METLTEYERGALANTPGAGLDWHAAQKALRVIDEQASALASVITRPW